MKNLLQIEFAVPDSRVDDVTVYLTENAPHGWQEELVVDREEVIFRVHFEDTAAAQGVIQGLCAAWPDLVVNRATIEQQDWATAWKEFFTPVEAGRFIVLPPWRADEAPEDRIPIIIEPKTAFGTGHHGTTALCLEAISNLAGEGTLTAGSSFFDLGTGSGILGIGCCKLGLTGLGYDIDPLAIENAEENRAINGVAEEAFSLGTGSVDGPAAGERFDLMVANILANPLKAMAPQIIDRVRPGGCLVLSGILVEQGDAVAEVYMANGLGEPERHSSKEWIVLIWRGVNR
ncbi:ribosomal protein L11 methyltransferase [Desulfobaculum xiamenense]|uniref:Ribosomal protein L11 methyltransferase n=1 Tax=Desulfobaculum xiamenense TaxID=995050 RepID=A0A846QFM6_9BACT|nr:50S ribosomal protein L11 methyltransferase [Desulfobaculum xiamenense]NJB67128.1 ribosomal protein L11 methyltransferase [Desulfobaculum xiamenense]